MSASCELSPTTADSGRELKVLAAFIAIFLVAFYLPVGVQRFDGALREGLELTKGYAQEHVLLCLIPALFIAGGISVFVNQASLMRYLGPKANKPLAYGVASVSGTMLAVCYCTVLPLFGGIWKRRAGLGPATAFLYSAPAINVLAILLTATILGAELGTARALGAISSLLLPGTPLVGFVLACAGLAILCARNSGEGRDWLESTWTLSKQIFPLLIGGVFVSGMLLGRPGHEALIPSEWVSGSAGGNSLAANLVSAVVGAFMYFATLAQLTDQAAQELGLSYQLTKVGGLEQIQSGTTRPASL